MRAGAQMLNQVGVGSWAYSPQQDKIKIIFISDDFEIISGLNFAAGSYRFEQDDLSPSPY